MLSSLLEGENVVKENNAVIVRGKGALEKSMDVVESYGLPAGILAVEDAEEAGIVEETGEVWIKQPKDSKHYFKMADKHVSYSTHISCKLERGKMKNIKGVKAKDMMVWVPVNEIEVDEKDPSKIHFRSFGGLSRSFPVEFYCRGA